MENKRSGRKKSTQIERPIIRRIRSRSNGLRKRTNTQLSLQSSRLIQSMKLILTLINYMKWINNN